MEKNEALASPEERTSFLRRVPLAETLALLVAAVYLRSIWGRFLWDDAFLLFNYPGRWGALRDIWTGRNSFDFFPLSQTMFWVEARLWNLDARGYHIVNIALHVIAVVLLWQVLTRLRIPGAWLGALIFAIHPLCVESVAWIAEGKNTLSLALYAATLLAYLQFEERPRIRGYELALGLFVLALLAKTAAVMLPFVLLLFAWWQRGRITRQDLLRSLPFFVASVILGLVTIRFQVDNPPGGDPVAVASLWERIQQAGVFFAFYLSKAIFPYGLLTLYPSFVSVGVLPDLAVAGGAVALWSYRSTAWGRGACFGMAYYGLSLAPTLGFFKMAFWLFAPVADRFQYFALIGITALAGAALASAPWKLAYRAAVAAALCAVLAGAAILEQQAYHSEVAMWRRQVAATPLSVRALDLLGGALIGEHRYAEALEYLEEAAAIDPKDPTVPRDLGAALLGVGRLEEAVPNLKEAHRLFPNSPATLNNLGMAYAQLHRLDEAAAAYADLLRENPENAQAHDNLGTILSDQGRRKEAIEEFRKALDLGGQRSVTEEHLEQALRQDLDKDK